MFVIKIAVGWSFAVEMSQYKSFKCSKNTNFHVHYEIELKLVFLWQNCPYFSEMTETPWIFL